MHLLNYLGHFLDKNKKFWKKSFWNFFQKKNQKKSCFFWKNFKNFFFKNFYFCQKNVLNNEKDAPGSVESSTSIHVRKIKLNDDIEFIVQIDFALLTQCCSIWGSTWFSQSHKFKIIPSFPTSFFFFHCHFDQLFKTNSEELRG